jgi:integrase
MAIRQKRDGGQYYYEFMAGGKRYNGVCEGCTTKRDAEKYEKEQRRLIAELAKAKDASELFEIRQRELTGNSGIPLAAAFELAMKKPRKRQPAEGQRKSKQSVFADFVAFLQGEYPDTPQEVAAVTRQHAEAYISHIQAKGRYVVRNSYTRDGKIIERATRKIETAAADGTTIKEDASTIPSPRTQKLFLTTCEEVFRLLMNDAGISRNPFTGIVVAADDADGREAFTDDELKRIYDNLDDFTRPLFMTAVYTGMREGDICTLRRDEVDLINAVIRRRQRKTGNAVEIPIAQPLYELFAASQMVNHTGEYMFPELAEMYLNNRCGVSRRVKLFLERIGIETTKTPPGRSRAVSVKDLHSCRHTFCYIAGMNGVPLATVQAIVGHMTPEMTKHYMAHATLADKRQGVKALSGGIAKALEIGFTIGGEIEPERAELMQIIKTADITLVKSLLSVTKRDIKK